MTIGEKLDKLIAKRRTNQSRLSKQTGLPQSAISELIAGKRQPKLQQAFLLAQALNVSLLYLADDAMEEEPTPDLTPEEEVVLIIARDLGPTEARRRLLRPPGPVFELLEPQAEPSPNPKPGSHRTGTR